jgi:hypothetical protein
LRRGKTGKMGRERRENVKEKKWEEKERKWEEKSKISAK